MTLVAGLPYIIICMIVIAVAFYGIGLSVGKGKDNADAEPAQEQVYKAENNSAAVNNSEEVNNSAQVNNNVQMSCGVIKLQNVDEPMAAIIMAIVSDESGIPLSELCFKSIKVKY